MFHPIAQKYPVDEFVPNLVYADVSNGAIFLSISSGISILWEVEICSFLQLQKVAVDTV